MLVKFRSYGESHAREFLKLFIDIGLVAVAYYLAFCIRFDCNIDAIYYAKFEATFPLVIGIFALLLIHTGIYRGIWKYASLHDLGRIAASISFGSAILFVIFWAIWPVNVPRGVLIIFSLLSILLLSGTRAAHTIIMIYLSHIQNSYKRVLIVGAGNAAEMIVRQMQQNPALDYLPIGFVDDNPKRRGTRIHGLRVLGGIADIPRLVRQHKTDEILLAIPSATALEMRRAVKLCEEAHVPFKTLPGVKELLDGTVALTHIRPVKIEDLLERTPSAIDHAAMARLYEGKVVLVTGAAGSIGSELCRQLVRLKPKLLLMLDRAESDLYDIGIEIDCMSGVKCPRKSIICDVRNFDRLRAYLLQYRPQIILHAAAYKHVPLMEHHPDEAVLNNIFGTLNVSRAAAQSGAERFVLVSTDKAVSPTNVMGATKRVCELYCISQNGHTPLKHVAVRFGNVLGSKGSVIPLFQKQIRSGGPVTITHRDIERFFMTIPEAVELILQAGVLGQGGEIFVLDMGQPLNLYDMARHLITLSGYIPDKDIKIEITGLRKGEKLYEELWTSEEQPQATEIAKIMRASNTLQSKNGFNMEAIQRLHRAAQKGHMHEIKQILMEIVPNAKLQDVRRQRYVKLSTGNPEFNPSAQELLQEFPADTYIQSLI